MFVNIVIYIKFAVRLSVCLFVRISCLETKVIISTLSRPSMEIKVSKQTSWLAASDEMV